MGADIPPRPVCDTSPCDIKTGIVGFTSAVNGEILSLKKIVVHRDSGLCGSRDQKEG
jgi:hypothetical protein